MPEPSFHNTPQPVYPFALRILEMHECAPRAT